MSSEISPAQQVAIAQRKLEKHYTSIFKALLEYQHSIEVVQHVLVWRRPVLSLALYTFVHWIFVWVQIGGIVAMFIKCSAAWFELHKLFSCYHLCMNKYPAPNCLRDG